MTVDMTDVDQFSFLYKYKQNALKNAYYIWWTICSDFIGYGFSLFL